MVKRFRIRVRFADGSGEPWWEDYEKPVADVESWGRELVEEFNATCRPNERRRVFLAAEELKEAPREHTWEKVNLVTVIRGDQCYDVMKCFRCGVTGKRHGLGQHGVTIDSAFRGVRFLRCDTAAKLIEKRRAKGE